ncbi:putative preprotein translocase, YajC subunit [Actinomyces sp. oral taxon 848 str. F0332]|nr:putative preprotein translocase, YajC subunit [Actinomyces sp. oral taxon 848 str. F0332]
MDPTMIALLVGMVILFFWMSYSGRKARERLNQEREEIIVVGKDIMTTAGFYGKIVDIDGDAVTLLSPAGDETVWDRRAISKAAELPLAESEEVDSEDDAEGQAEADVEAESADAPDEDRPKPSSPFSSDR